MATEGKEEKRRVGRGREALTERSVKEVLGPRSGVLVRLTLGVEVSGGGGCGAEAVTVTAAMLLKTPRFSRAAGSTADMSNPVKARRWLSVTFVRFFLLMFSGMPSASKSSLSPAVPPGESQGPEAARGKARGMGGPGGGSRGLRRLGVPPGPEIGGG